MAQYPCPQCSGKMFIEKVHEGYEVPCPHCGNRFRVPRGASGETVAAPPPPPEPGPAPEPAQPAAEESPLEFESREQWGGGREEGTEPPRRRPLPEVPGPRSTYDPVSGTRPDEQGVLILVLGIVSILFCQILGIVPWIMGNNARQQARGEGREPDGMVTAGWILGIVSVAMTVLTFCGLGLFFVLAAAAQ